METLRHTVGKMIMNLGIRLQREEYAMSEEEMLSVMRLLLHEKWYIARICRELHCTQRTLERWCKDGVLPPLRKEYGGKKFLWHDEVLPYVVAINNRRGK